jgi:hypothetical protein
MNQNNALVIVLAFAAILSAQTAHYVLTDAGVALPDPVFSPGVVLTTHANTICSPGYSKAMRKLVHKATLQAVATAYGVKLEPKKRELDHIVSLENGGAPDDPKNLVPQPRRKSVPKGVLAAEDKDRLENLLHKKACAGEITFEEAQADLMNDWTVAYRQYIGATQRIVDVRVERR